MTRISAACVLAALSIVAASANANEKLAQASGCLTCHGVDKKVIGPSFKEIATKYRNDKSAEAGLIKKVKAGGNGVWGEVPMPPNPHVKDPDVKSLVEWILSTN
jgi:cytochrome c